MIKKAKIAKEMSNELSKDVAGVTKILATNITDTTKSFLTGLYNLALVGTIGNLPSRFRERVAKKLNCNSAQIGLENIITNILAYPSASYFITRNLTSNNNTALSMAGGAFVYSLVEGYFRYEIMDDIGDNTYCPSSVPGLIASIPLFVTLSGKEYIKSLYSRAKRNIESEEIK